MNCMMSSNYSRGMDKKQHAYTPPKKSSLEVVGESELNMNDVLCGRGGWVNSFPGNLQFRELLKQNKDAYNDAKKLEKMAIVTNIVKTIRDMVPSGRFLKEDKTKNGWVDIGDAKAVKKCGQAMRQTKVENTRRREAVPTRQEIEEPIAKPLNTSISRVTKTVQIEKNRALTPGDSNISSNGIERRRRFQSLVCEPSCLPPPPQKEPVRAEILYESEELMKENLLLAKSIEEDSLKDP